MEKLEPRYISIHKLRMAVYVKRFYKLAFVFHEKNPPRHLLTNSPYIKHSSIIFPHIFIFLRML